jgi:Flp pilus assembly protein TadG
MTRILTRTKASLQVASGARLNLAWAGIRSRTGNEGGSLVEFALVLPILMIVMTGIFTFGIALNSYMELTNAVTTGAQVLAVSRSQTTDPCAAAASAVYAAAPTLDQSQLSFTIVLDGVTAVSGATSPVSCNSASANTGYAADLVEGLPATITVTYPCNLSIYGYNYAPSCSLQAQLTEVVQ